MKTYSTGLEFTVKNSEGKKISKTTHEIFDLEYGDLVAVEETMVNGVFGGLIEMGKSKASSGK